MYVKFTYQWGKEWETYFALTREDCKDATDRSAYDALAAAPDESCIQVGKVHALRMPDPEELKKLHRRLFDLANAHAGSGTGNVALYLHEAANNVARALECIECGNPPALIPARFILASMGLGSE